MAALAFMTCSLPWIPGSLKMKTNKLTGSTLKREAVISAFRKKDIPVFLITIIKASEFVKSLSPAEMESLLQ